jgi:ribonuclease E
MEAGRRFTEDDARESDESGETDDFTTDEDAGDSAGTTTGDENAPRKRRRRRRRRRSRSGEGEATANAVTGEPGAAPAADREKPSEPARSRNEESPRTPERREGRERPGRDDDSRPPRRGRRDRRGHSAPVAGERHEFSDDEFGVLSTDDEPMNAGDNARADHPADDDGDLGEPAVNYADVPTWEEAISYLLHPNQVQVESNGGSGPGSGGGGSSEQSRQNRHYGGRRR